MSAFAHRQRSGTPGSTRRQPAGGGYPQRVISPVLGRSTPNPAGQPPHRLYLRELSAFLAVGLGLTVLYVLSGDRLGLPCPLRLATGLDCPLCGGTRMAAALLHGDITAAWHYNAMVLVGVAAVGLWWLLTIGYKIGLVHRLPRLPARWQRPAIIAGLVVVLAFSVARNLPVGPLAGWQV